MKQIQFRISSLAILVNMFYCAHQMGIRNNDDLFTVNVTMSGYATSQNDEYAYILYTLPDEELFVVGFSPFINMEAAHHMLTYACNTPDSLEPFWNRGGACVGDQMIIHSWARDAPELKLPDDVGFAVGRNTPYKYIVINIHYLSLLKNDYSGNQLIMTRKRPRRYAGVVLVGSSNIVLPPRTHTVQTHFSCLYHGPSLSVFAASVHTHRWGRVNSLYRVRSGKISQIIKSNPKWSETFYRLPSPVEILHGDYFVGQCVYDNDDNRTITVGFTGSDEMCNVYTMYTYEPQELPDDNKKNYSTPFRICWDNKFNNVTSLIPPDSEIPPLNPADIFTTSNDAYTNSQQTVNTFAANKYTNVEYWLGLTSLATSLGQIGGLAIDNKNDELVVFHRGSRIWESKYFDGNRFRNDAYGSIEENVLVHIDIITGQNKLQWGAKMFYMPHGLTIDDDGNFWLTDVAMHQVLMFKPTNLTQPSLTVGKMFEPGSGPNHLCQPADVAVLKNGDFFVADGYCNGRIVKFNFKGEYVTEWGSPTSGKLASDGFPPPNEWNIVHSIAISEEAKLLCGADRENCRIQCFDLNTAQFLRQIRITQKGIIGAIYSIQFAPNTNGSIIFAVTGGEQTLDKRIYMIDSNNGIILNSFDSQPQFESPQDLAISSDATEIYVGELLSSSNNMIHKFELIKDGDLPTKWNDKLILLSDKTIRVVLFVILALIIAIVIYMTVACILCIRNARRINCSNALTTNVERTNTNRRSLLVRWSNQRRGFKKLEPWSDGENEVLSTNSDDKLNNNSDDEILNVGTNTSATLSKYKSGSIRLNMVNSL